MSNIPCNQIREQLRNNQEFFYGTSMLVEKIVENLANIHLQNGSIVCIKEGKETGVTFFQAATLNRVQEILGGNELLYSLLQKSNDVDRILYLTRISNSFRQHSKLP